MGREWFRAVADRLTEPLILLSPAAVVLDRNRAAIRALGPDLADEDLAARAGDPSGFRRYITLASRSASALPGAVEFDGGTSRWRCDASVVVLDRQEFVILQLRAVNDVVARCLALNQQIAKLRAEICQREHLEHERDVLLARAQEARADAEEASRFKDELLASISHELRTPLHAIAGWLALLRESPGDSELLDHGLEVIERNVGAQAQLTEDLVDASLAITGRMRLELRPVDLEHVIREAIEAVRPSLDAKQQQLEVSASAGSCIVNGDRGRLLQVVWNLLSNATKYTAKGGEIRVQLRKVESRAELAVSDTGIGIAAELLPHVFDRFSRGDGTSTRRYGGLGLGLAISRHLVELHGGVISAHSEGLGRGTTVVIQLPLPVLRAGAAVPQASPVKLSGVRTLLVEDHDDSRELLASILRARGATVIAVDRASLAQDEFRNQLFDVVVSDIEMPDEDGYALMRKLRELERELERPPVPAVAVSAHSLRDAQNNALSAGYQAFLPKPLRPSELVATITNLIERR